MNAIELTRYDGGQLEFHDTRQGDLYRGQIERIALDDDILSIRLSWNAKAVRSASGAQTWVKAGMLEYSVSIKNYHFNDSPDGTIRMYLPWIKEMLILMPKGVQSLDHSEVEGLESIVT